MKKFSSLSELKSLINTDEIPSEPISNKTNSSVEKQYLEAQSSVQQLE